MKTIPRPLLKYCGLAVLLVGCLPGAANVLGQPLGQPDRESPGDERIQAYLAQESAAIESRFGDDLISSEHLDAQRESWKRQYWRMLGLWPLPEKSELSARITGTLAGTGFVVENLHYQSRPGLYVTANLYRPAGETRGQRLPAVLYVCGHSGRGRNGNKTAFQSHGIWFARHGYVCLIVDTLQLGEIAAIHHGTYNRDRWWWHSRGYTSAGVECWNGLRGIDYLISRDDVDAERIAVTGISGGGAATFWIAAADERVKVAVPVSGMADLESYVSNRVINGHCDCMFMINTYRWPWTRIASLIAPRPLLFVNSDHDPIFPMDANDRIANRMERVYSLFGAGDDFDALVSVGGHDYRRDIRQGTFRFIHSRLTGAASAISDSEQDLVIEAGAKSTYPIALEKLRVFPEDVDIPRDERNTTIDESFVPFSSTPAPSAGQFNEWKSRQLRELQEITFGYFPASIPAATPLRIDDASVLVTESPLRVKVRVLEGNIETASSIDLIVADETLNEIPDYVRGSRKNGERTAVVVLQPRGFGTEKWTRKNPPNYVERSHVLLGRTVDTGRVWDVVAVAKYLAGGTGAVRPVHVFGDGNAAIWAAYAGLWEDSIHRVTVRHLPPTHMDSAAPQFLNILQVGDVPEMLALLHPKPIEFVDTSDELQCKVRSITITANSK